MKRALIMAILALFLTAGPVQAGWNDWTKDDKALYITLGAWVTVDYFQTNYIFDSPDFKELNPIADAMGKDLLPLTCIGSMLLIYVVADHLSPVWRERFLVVANVVEFTNIGRNFSIGVKLSF